MSFLLVVEISPTADDDVGGSLKEGVILIFCDELLAVTGVINSWSVIAAIIVVEVLALTDMVDFVVVSCVDTEDDASPLK